MDTQKEQLLTGVEADREKLIDFFRRFIQAKSPNLPEDTVEEFIDVAKIHLTYAKPSCPKLSNTPTTP